MWNYVSHHRDDESADRPVEQIIAAANLLACQPGLGRDRSDLEPGLRGRAAKPTKYVILYRPIDDGVNVIRVMRGAAGHHEGVLRGLTALPNAPGRSLR